MERAALWEGTGTKCCIMAPTRCTLAPSAAL